MDKTQKTIPGGFVVFFDGMDGTGKTTQLQRASESLKAAGWLVQTSRSHGGTPIGEALRTVSLSDTLRPPLTDLHISLAIHASLAESVADWRQTGAIILLDRSPLSIIAYQQYGDHLASEIVGFAVAQDMNRFAAELSILYTAPVDVALERAHQKHKGKSDYFESKDRTYFERVHMGYLESAEVYESTVIDTGTATIEDVAGNTLKVIQDALTKHNK